MKCKECDQEKKNLNPEGLCWDCWKKANPNEVKREKTIEKESFMPGLEYSDICEDNPKIEVVKQEMLNNVKQNLLNNSRGDLLNNSNHDAFIGFRIPIEVKKDLQEIARQEHTSLSEIVRRKIMDY